MLLRLSLHFTPLHYTFRHFTSSHLHFAQLHFTTLSFGLSGSRYILEAVDQIPSSVDFFLGKYLNLHYIRRWSHSTCEEEENIQNFIANRTSVVQSLLRC